MQIEFFELIKKSFNFTLKYKILWIFGFILALTSMGGGSSNDVDRGSSSSTRTGNPDFRGVQDAYSNFTNQPYFWAVVIGVILIVIALSVLFWYLSRISSISIFRAVTHDDDGKPELIGFKKLWKESQQIVFKVMLYDLAWGLFFFTISLVVLLPVIFLLVAFGPLGIILLCCALVIFVPVMIVLVILNQFAMYLVINYGYDLKSSILQAWDMMKKEALNVFLYLMTGILVAIPYVFALFVVIIVLGIVIGIPMVLIITSVQAPIVAGILVAVLGILFILLLALVGAPYQVFAHAYEANFLNALLKKLENPLPKLVEVK